MVQHASGMKLQEVLEEAIIQPLNIQGELYIGIPPGILIIHHPTCWKSRNLGGVVDHGFFRSGGPAGDVDP